MDAESHSGEAAPSFNQAHQVVRHRHGLEGLRQGESPWFEIDLVLILLVLPQLFGLEQRLSY